MEKLGYLLGVAVIALAPPAVAFDKDAARAAVAVSPTSAEKRPLETQRVRSAPPIMAQSANGENEIHGNLGEDSPRDGRPYEQRNINLQAGQRYLMTASSDSFDPKLELHATEISCTGDSECDIDDAIAEDDDSGEGRAAALEYTPTISGSYKLRLTAVDGEIGPYTLHIRKLLPLRAPIRPTPAKTATLTVQTFSGTISTDDSQVQSRYVDDYLFKFEADKPAYIWLDRKTRGDMDPALVVFAADNVQNELASDDDGGDGPNSMISFTPAATGNFVIRVGTVGDQLEGNYELRVAQ